MQSAGKELNMDAAVLHANPSLPFSIMSDGTVQRRVGPTEFRKLLVSHRRMVRVDRRVERLRGLQDLDTGEVFLIDERQLLDARR
jgi:hypothetical protein